MHIIVFHLMENTLESSIHFTEDFHFVETAGGMKNASYHPVNQFGT